MEIKVYRRRRDQGLVGLAIVVLKRMVALFLLAFALNYWARITGLYPGDDVRFDTMPEHWRIAAPVLAVMLPVSALGLWGQFSWGTISWLLTVCAELGLFLGMPDLYGSNDKVVLFHLVSVGLYFVLKGFSRFIGGSRQILPVRHG